MIRVLASQALRHAKARAIPAQPVAHLSHIRLFSTQGESAVVVANTDAEYKSLISGSQGGLTNMRNASLSMACMSLIVSTDTLA